RSQLPGVLRLFFPPGGLCGTHLLHRRVQVAGQLQPPGQQELLELRQHFLAHLASHSSLPCVCDAPALPTLSGPPPKPKCHGESGCPAFRVSLRILGQFARHSKVSSQRSMKILLVHKERTLSPPPPRGDGRPRPSMRPSLTGPHCPFRPFSRPYRSLLIPRSVATRNLLFLPKDPKPNTRNLPLGPHPPFRKTTNTSNTT